MDQSKKLNFSVTLTYIVEVRENALFRARLAFREQFPEGDWNDDDSVINAIVQEYQCAGEFGDQVVGPWITITKMREPHKRP